MTGGLVLVDQATCSETIQQRLGGGESFGGGGSVIGVQRLDDFLDGSAQLRALGNVTFVAHHGLLGALFGGLDIGHWKS